MSDDQAGDMQDDGQTMVRTQIAIDEASFFLAQGQDLPELRSRIEQAVQAGGRFVSFVVVGNREVSALFTAHSRVALSVETVQYDPRDTGDSDDPYGGFFDA
ncbi:hypothetical protein MTES_2108 [Microbacterium testaceum StLB037]|uniref:Uncharacterized protein n=1 Tax=Microbacterium testaceum (strain StLB037) TaxID=979556 RepID=E8NE27_MICTS|nr:hypothetical protein [Microbacterium testaceum]BAJ75072.1 hypothetical protein MTES_2108 [Microbacterium testaceum StLB037]